MEVAPQCTQSFLRDWIIEISLTSSPLEHLDILDRCRTVEGANNHLKEQNSCSDIGWKVEEVMGHLSCRHHYHHYNFQDDYRDGLHNYHEVIFPGEQNSCHGCGL